MYATHVDKFCENKSRVELLDYTSFQLKKNKLKIDSLIRSAKEGDEGIGQEK